MAAKTYQQVMDGDDFIKKAGSSVFTFDNVVERGRSEDEELRSLTVRVPDDKWGEYLIIARFDCDGEAMVSFRSGGSFAEVLCGFIRSWHARRLEMRRDEYGKR